MILFIDACVRDESRTRDLAGFLLEKLDQQVETLNLSNANISNLTKEKLNRRTDACAKGDYSSSEFKYANQFASADTIVIAAPYWDLSFPALLKEYIETICVTGITFKYSEEGMPIGLCRAKDLFYVTTAGGPIIDTAFGYGYIEALAKGMFGIKNTVLFSAENLDIVGNDVEKIMKNSKETIELSLRK